MLYNFTLLEQYYLVKTAVLLHLLKIFIVSLYYILHLLYIYVDEKTILFLYFFAQYNDT